MRSAFVYNFLIEANIMASIAIILMIPLRKSTDSYYPIPVCSRYRNPTDCRTDQGAHIRCIR